MEAMEAWLSHMVIFERQSEAKQVIYRRQKIIPKQNNRLTNKQTDRHIDRETDI